MEKRMTIYPSPPIEKLKERAGNRGFSRRLAQVVERYDLVIANTPPIPLTQEEEMIFGTALSGSMLEPLAIKYLHTMIEDFEGGLPEDRKALAKKIEAASIAERIATIEYVGL